MSFFQKILSGVGSDILTINSKKAARVSQMPGGLYSFSVNAKTGTIPAAVAAGAAVFAMRLDPDSPLKAYIDTIRLRYTTIVAFTTPVTQTRSLVLTRGSGAAASAGTAIAAVNPKDTTYAASQFDAAEGGDVRISATAVLTITGITFETVNFGELTLAHVGSAGNYVESLYEYGPQNHPIELNPGQLLAVRVGASAMDAAGTWSLGVEVNWHEGTDYDV